MTKGQSKTRQKGQIGAPQISALAEELEIIGYGGARKGKARLLARLDAAMAAFAAEAEKALE